VQNPDEYSNYQSQAYHTVAEAQTNAGDLAEAQATAELIKTAFLKCQSQIAIASAQTKAGDVAGAQQTLARR